jgi:hypothetical protein
MYVQRALSVKLEHCTITDSRASSGYVVMINQVFQVSIDQLTVERNTGGGSRCHIIHIEDILPLNGIETCQVDTPTTEPHLGAFGGSPISFRRCQHSVNLTGCVFKHNSFDATGYGKWFKVVSILGGPMTVGPNVAPDAMGVTGYWHTATATFEKCNFEHNSHNATMYAFGVLVQAWAAAFYSSCTFVRFTSDSFAITMLAVAHYRHCLFDGCSDLAFSGRPVNCTIVECNFTKNVNKGTYTSFNFAPMGVSYIEAGGKASPYREFEVWKSTYNSDGNGGTLPYRMYVYGCNFVGNEGKSAGAWEIIASSPFKGYPEGFNQVHFRNCKWSHNIAGSDNSGGAFHISGAVKVLLEGCILSDNSCGSTGPCAGAVSVREGAVLELRNTTLSSNFVPDSGVGGSAIECFSATVLIMDNSLVTNHSGTNAIRARGCVVKVNGSTISNNKGVVTLVENRRLPEKVVVASASGSPEVDNACGVSQETLSQGAYRFLISDHLAWSNRTLGRKEVQIYQQPPNLDCAWTIYGTTGATVRVRGKPPFGSIESKPGSQDRIHLHAGTSTADPQLESWGGRFPINASGWSHTLEGGVLHVWFRTSPIPILVSQYGQKYSGFQMYVDVNISSGTAINAFDGGAVEIQGSHLVNNDCRLVVPATVRSSNFTSAAVVPNAQVVLPCSAVCHSTALCADYSAGGPSKRCWCPGASFSGEVSRGGACTCPAGHGGSMCAPCGQGTASARAFNDARACVPCARMHFAGSRGAMICTRCKDGTFNTEEGTSTCSDCAPRATPSKYSHNDTGGGLCGTYCKVRFHFFVGCCELNVCVVYCKAGYFWHHLLTNVNATNVHGLAGECKLCSVFAVGADCTKPGLLLSTLPAKPGYWRMARSSTVFTECAKERASQPSQATATNSTLPLLQTHYSCPGGTVSHQCHNLTRTDVVLCSKCIAGYKRVASRCEQCPANDSKGTMAVSIAFTLLFLVLAFTRWFTSDEGWYIHTKRTLHICLVMNKRDAEDIIRRSGKRLVNTWVEKRALKRWQHKHAIATRMDAAFVIQKWYIRKMHLEAAHISTRTKGAATAARTAASTNMTTDVPDRWLTTHLEGWQDRHEQVQESHGKLAEFVHGVQQFDWHHLAASLKIIVGWSQCVGSFDRTFTGIPWPPEFLVVIERLQSVFSDMFNIFAWSPGLECSFNTSFQWQLLVTLLQLPVALAVLLPAYSIAVLRARTMEEKTKKFTTMGCYNRLSRVLSIVVFFVYPSVCTKCFLAFRYTEIDGVTYLSEDLTMRVRCDEAHAAQCDEVMFAGTNIDSGYYHTRLLAVLGLVFIVIGIPLYYMCELYKHRVQIWNDPEASGLKARYGSLYADYRKEYYYFELVDMLRKMLLTGGLIVIRSGEELGGQLLQIAVGMSVCFFHLILMLSTLPYEDSVLGKLQITVGIQLFFSLVIAMVLVAQIAEQAGATTHGSVWSGSVLMGLYFISLATGFVAAFYTLATARSALGFGVLPAPWAGFKSRLHLMGLHAHLPFNKIGHALSTSADHAPRLGSSKVEPAAQPFTSADASGKAASIAAATAPMPADSANPDAGRRVKLPALQTSTTTVKSKQPIKGPPTADLFPSSSK